MNYTRVLLGISKEGTDVGKQQECPLQFTTHTHYLGKLFKDVFQKTRSKPCKRHGFWKTVAPTQELHDGKIQAAAVYNLRERVLAQIAGGEQRALSEGKGR